jgi:heavy metal sensor kinase
MNTRSLRFQLGLWYAGLLAGVFLLLGLATIAALRHYLEANLRDSQLHRAKQIALGLSPALVRAGPSAISQEIEERFSPGANNRFVRVRRANGSVLYQSTPPQDASFDPSSVPLWIWPERGPSARQVAVAGKAPLLVVSYLSRASNSVPLLVEAGAPLDTVQAVLTHVALVMAVTLAAAVVAAVAGGYFLIGRALATVDHIARSAEQISLQNLSGRLPIARSGDEIEDLSVALNRMIARLDEAFQNSKRFVADASHELRTPLTVLRGELESLVESEPLNPAVREQLGSVLEEVDRLAKVVEGLLTLSRLDAGEAQREWLRLDLAKLTVSTADQMSLLAEDKSIVIQCTTPAPVFVQGDRTRLKQVIVNLLDNAIKYTPPKGSVSLQVYARDGRACLEIADSGIGIPPDVLPHVFDRFFRADQARSRDLGGAGLGLAIVRSICVAHSGRVEVESVENRGSRFRVELPLAPITTEGGAREVERSAEALSARGE